MSYWGGARALEPESIDIEPAGVAVPEMRDLVRINRWFGGRWVLPGLLAQFASRGDQFSVLDIGAGSGDIGRRVRESFPNAVVASLDKRPEFLGPARPPCVVADAFLLPFPERSFDFVTCSLFLHHFSNEQIVELLAAFHRVARRALIVVDLERHRLAYHFVPATRWLFGWHALTVRDACISVQAGFRPQELAGLAHQAGHTRFEIRRHRPWFRLSLVAPV